MGGDDGRKRKQEVVELYFKFKIKIEGGRC